MRIDYVADVDLPPEGKWTSESMLDPLHPMHGPLPDLFGRLAVETQAPGINYFEVALWDTPSAILTMVERRAEEDPDPAAPIHSIEEAHSQGGWIARTFLWKIREGGRAFICGSAEVFIPNIPSGTEYLKEWSRLIYREVMVESVRLTVSASLGREVMETFRKLRQMSSR